MAKELPVYYLDGEHLTPEDVWIVLLFDLQLMDLGYGKYKLDLTKEAWEKVDVGQGVPTFYVLVWSPGC